MNRFISKIAQAVPIFAAFFGMTAQADPSTQQSYHLTFAQNQTKCLDILKSSTEEGTHTEINDCGSETSQTINLVPIAGSFGFAYQLVDTNTKMCLDVTGQSTSDGALIDQWPCLGATHLNQIWKLQSYSGSYQIRSVDSGKCIDLNDGSTQDGNFIQQWDCGNGNNTNQLWNFVANSGQGQQGPYQITFGSNSAKCLDVTGASTADGTDLQIYDCKGANQLNQIWNLRQIEGPVGGSYQTAYQVVSANTGKCMDVAKSSTSDGARVDQLTCGSSTTLNQIWELKNFGSHYELISALSGKCLDLNDGNTTNQNFVQQWDCDLSGKNNNQLWNLTTLGGSLGAGPYEVVSKINASKCLDVSAISNNDGAPIDLWDCLGSAQTNQLWNLAPSGNGYSLIAVNSGKCLDVYQNSTANGGKIDQSDCLNHPSQIWQLRPFSGGYQLVSSESGKCLDDPSGNVTNNTDLQQWDCDGTGNNPDQLWSFNTPASLPVNETSEKENVLQVDNYNASGSTQTISCSGTAGTNTVTCTPGVGDFKVDQGIMITGAGQIPVVTQISQAPGVYSTVQGKGSHEYCYIVASADAVRGITAPSAAACLSNMPILAGGADRVLFTSMQPEGGYSPNILYYASLDKGPYQLIAADGYYDYGIIQDLGQRPGDLGGWPAILPTTNTSTLIKNEDLFSTIVQVAGSQITLADKLIHSTAGIVLVAHDDTQAVQAAILAGQKKGGAIIQFSAKTYNIQRPVWMTNGNYNPATYEITESPTWAGSNYLYVDNSISSGNIHLNGAGKMLTHLVSGPQMNDNSGNFFMLGGIGTANELIQNRASYRIANVAKASTQLQLSNGSQASNFAAGDDIWIYGQNFGYSNPNPPITDVDGTPGGNSINHYSEWNTVASVGSNGVLNLVYPTSKKYFADSNGDSFGVANVKGIPFHNFSVSNLWITSQNSLFRGQSVIDLMVDSIYMDGHMSNPLGGNRKRNMTIQNSTWTIGTGIPGWDSTDEFDQFVNLTLINNQVYGNSSPGSEGPSASAQIYATEGTSQITLINNDFYNMIVQTQDTTDDIVKGNRFHDAFMSFGDSYQNGADMSYLNFASQASIAVSDNTFNIDTSFNPPWILKIGHFDSASITGNTINVNNSGGSGIIVTGGGSVTGNSVTTTDTTISPYGIEIQPDPAPGSSAPTFNVQNNVISTPGNYSWDVRVLNPGAKYGSSICVQNNSEMSWNGQQLGIDNPADVKMSCVGL